MEGSSPRRIKVFIVINDFLIGGAQKLIVDLLTRLDRTRFELSLSTLFQFEENEQNCLYDTLPEGVPVYKLRFRSIYDLASWRALYRVLRHCDPDIVLSNLFFSNTVTRILSIFFRYHTLTVEHNTYTKKTKLHQMIDRLLTPLSARIVAVSKTVATFTVKQESIDPDKFIVIHNGIDVEKIRNELHQNDSTAVRKEFGLMSGNRVIINVARVVPQKNHKMLLDGFAIFAREYPNYRLFIIGGGSDLEGTKEYANAIGLHDSVQFLGYRKDVPRFLSIADFFVSTSFIEGFGIAHAEALACGVPVLTTKTAGPDEMIMEGVNGFFISAYTPESVAEGLQKLSECNLTSMREATAHSVEEYSIERAVAAYEELFEKTAQRRT